MRDEPADLSRELVAEQLHTGWAVAAAKLTYAPVGFGSYHWVASDRTGPRWFLTADYLAPGGSWVGPTPERIFTGLTAAASVQKQLAAAGYEFVVPPLPDRTGRLVRRVGPHWSLQVFPYLEGSSTDYGPWQDPQEQAQIARLVGRLHAADPPATLPHWDVEVPGRRSLHSAAADLDRPWHTGPYAERTRRLLAGAAGGIRLLLDRYDELVRAIEADPDPWVVTHGEPHSGNLIRGSAGRPYLIDWDTVRLAPRERDLAAVLHGSGGDAEVLSAYQETAGRHAPRPAALELFALWWALAEIFGYVQLFRAPHDESADAAESWRNLCYYAPGGEGPEMR